MVNNRTISRNMVWYTVGSSFYMFMMWIMTVLVVRISGFSAAGLLSLAMSATNVLYTISIWGMRSYQVSDIDGLFSDGTYIISRFITSTVALVACLVFVFLNSYDQQTFLCIVIFMLFRISEAFSDVLGGVLQKSWRLDIVGRSFIIRGTVSILSFSITLSVTDHLPLSLLMMTVCSFLVVLSYEFIHANRLIRRQESHSFLDAGKLLYQCLPLVISNFLYTLNAFVPRYYLELLEGDTMLGIYASIAAPVLVIQLLSSFVFSPLIPLFSQHHRNQNPLAFKRLLMKVTSVVFLISVISLAGGFLAGKFLLNLLFGPDILEYTSVLTLVIVSVISTTFIWLLNGVMTALRKIRHLMLYAMVGTFASLIISKPLVLALGMDGVSIALTAAHSLQILMMIISVMIYLRHMQRRVSPSTNTSDNH